MRVKNLLMFLTVVAALAGCGDELPQPVELTLTAEEVAEWTPEEVEARTTELEAEIAQLNALKAVAEEELALIAPSAWNTAEHFGRIKVTDRDCVETLDSGFSDIITIQPILRDGNGNALGTFTPLFPTDVPDGCLVAMTWEGVEPPPEAPLYELDMGRRGNFVITEAELAGNYDSADDRYQWFDLSIG